MFKVLLYAYDKKKEDYNTKEGIGKLLGISQNQVTTAISNLLNCSFQGNCLFEKDYERISLETGERRIIGTILEFYESPF